MCVTFFVCLPNRRQNLAYSYFIKATAVREEQLYRVARVNEDIMGEFAKGVSKTDDDPGGFKTPWIFWRLVSGARNCTLWPQSTRGCPLDAVFSREHRNRFLEFETPFNWLKVWMRSLLWTLYSKECLRRISSLCLQVSFLVDFNGQLPISVHGSSPHDNIMAISCISISKRIYVYTFVYGYGVITKGTAQ